MAQTFSVLVSQFALSLSVVHAVDRIALNGEKLLHEYGKRLKENCYYTKNIKF